VFSGTSTHTLDAKGRLFLPKRVQEELDRDAEGKLGFVLTRGLEGCLFLFSRSGFESIQRGLALQPFGDAEMRTLQRMFFAHAYEGPLDANGRLLLPEKLRALAGIEREVAVVGVANRAEIWSRPAWEQFEIDHDADFQRLEHVFMGRGGPTAAPS
jgi:MraZ protein